MIKQYARHSKKVTATKRWQVLRAAVLERDGWKCRGCDARSHLEVDHINPVRTHPRAAFDPENLQTLCRACHTKKTRIECGHKPASESRQAWRQSVLTLQGWSKTKTHEMEKPHA